MKKLLPAVIVATALSWACMASAKPETFILDPAHTNIIWHANHFGFSNPSGKFATVEGTLVLDEANPEKSKVEAVISTESITTGNPKFDAHLKSLDFFNVERHAKASFVSTRVERTGKDTAKVTGQFTMLGATLPLTLDVKLNKIGEHPMTKKKTVGFSATTTIERSRYGMTFGIPNVSDEVKIEIETEANLADTQ